jgi:protein-tyrosine-phosphatase
MAEGMLRRLLAVNGVRADIGSAGLLRGGAPATRDAIAVMAARGIDVSRHVSHTIDPEVVRSTPLVIGMAREHAREAVAIGAAADRTFALRELVRLGGETGPRGRDESLPDWLARVGARRASAALVGDDDDIPDPVGRPRAAYEEAADELDILLRRLVALMTGGPPRSAAQAGPPAARSICGGSLTATGGR